MYATRLRTKPHIHRVTCLRCGYEQPWAKACRCYDAERAAEIRRLQPLIREGFARLRQAREELGIADGEPLVGLGK